MLPIWGRHMDDFDRDALKIIWGFTFAFGSAWVYIAAVNYGIVEALITIGMLAFMAALFSLVVLVPLDH